MIHCTASGATTLPHKTNQLVYVMSFVPGKDDSPSLLLTKMPYTPRARVGVVGKIVILDHPNPSILFLKV
eukprot:COSAG05_NODE_2334_length_3218_cov_5.193331_2_plen_70_part_00